jgi:hypothetical protein
MASISDIVQQYTDMRQGLKHLRIELDTYWKKSESDKDENKTPDRFFLVMEEHLSSATRRFEEVETLYVNVDAKWKDTMTYYGENPRNQRPDEFFNIFAQFLANWKLSAAEELKYTEQQELEEKRKQDLEARRLKATASNGDTAHGERDRRLMDDLLEKLRSGETEQKLRQRRVRQRLRKLKNVEAPKELVRKLSNGSSKSLLHVKRSTSVSSSASSSVIPLISAEDLLRSLQQEDE